MFSRKILLGLVAFGASAEAFAPTGLRVGNTKPALKATSARRPAVVSFSSTSSRSWGEVPQRTTSASVVRTF